MCALSLFENNYIMTDKENTKKTWLEQQPTEFIKNLKSVQTITYPDGKKEYLNGTFFIL